MVSKLELTFSQLVAMVISRPCCNMLRQATLNFKNGFPKCLPVDIVVCKVHLLLSLASGEFRKTPQNHGKFDLVGGWTNPKKKYGLVRVKYGFSTGKVRVWKS